MIVALDLTSAAVGEVHPSVQELVVALAAGGSPAGRLVVLAREEHRIPLRHLTHGLATILTLDRPDPDRRQVDEYRRRKLDLVVRHSVQLLHVAGGPLDLPSVSLPVVWSIDGLDHRTSAAGLTADERGLRETWYTASAFRADAVIVPDAATRADLHRQLGVPVDHVFVRPAAAGDLTATLAAAYTRATRVVPSGKAA